MKKFLIVSITAALAFSSSAFAQAKKKEPAKPADAPAADAKKPDAKADAKPAAEAKAAKPLPFGRTAAEIDAATKTITHVNKDGTKVKLVVTDKTEFVTGKFEDIKVGDSVNGLFLKKAENEYEVVKITKFGAKAPAAKKDAAPAKDAPAKDAPKKDAPKKE